jgi:hypothetical protein
MVINRFALACCAATVSALASAALAGEPAPIGKKVSVYHVGNSLTRGLTTGNGNGEVDRIDPLFESAGGNYKYMSVKPYEQIDENEDAELIKAVQQTIWDIVSTHPHTGVKAVPATNSAMRTNEGAAR